MMKAIRSFFGWMVGAVTSWDGLPVSDSKLARLLGLVKPTASGENVTPESALSLAAYFACMRVVCEDTAKLPCQVFKRGAGRVIQTDHPVYDLVHDAPNPHTTPMAFWESMLADAQAHGGGFAEIERKGSGQPIALWKLDGGTVTPELDDDDQLVYRVPSQGRTLRPDQVFHLHGLGPDSLTGWSIAEAARESLGEAIAAQKYGAAFYGSSAMPQFAIELPENLKGVDDKTLDALKRSWIEKTAGATKMREPKFMIPGFKLHHYSISPKDADFILSRQFSVEEICRWFRVAPHKIQHLLRATNNNIEHQSIEHGTDTLHPWAVRIAQEANRKLFLPSERKLYYVEHNLDAVLRGDSAARSKFYRELWGIGAMTINEIREKENMPTIGADGDKHFVPVNYTTIDRLGEIQNLQPPAATDPPADDDEENEEEDSDDDETKELKSDARAAIAEVIGRLLRQETSAILKAAEVWSTFVPVVDAFYVKHEAKLQTALRSVARLWVRIERPKKPAAQVALDLAAVHCQSGKEMALAASEVDSYQLPGSISRALQSAAWSDRVEQTINTVMEKWNNES